MTAANRVIFLPLMVIITLTVGSALAGKKDKVEYRTINKNGDVLFTTNPGEIKPNEFHYAIKQLEEEAWANSQLARHDLEKPMKDDRDVVAFRAAFLVNMPIEIFQRERFCSFENIVKMSEHISYLFDEDGEAIDVDDKFKDKDAKPRIIDKEKGIYLGEYQGKADILLHTMWDCYDQQKLAPEEAFAGFFHKPNMAYGEPYLVYEQKLFNYDSYTNRAVTHFQFYPHDNDQTLVIFAGYTVTRKSWLNGAIVEGIIEGVEDKIEFNFEYLSHPF